MYSTCVLASIEMPDGGIRPITDFKRHKTYGSVNHCGSLIRRFQSMSVANVTEHLSQNDFISVTDI